MFRTEDFSERMNFKIAPFFEFQVIAVIGIVVNFLFCYFWEVGPLYIIKHFRLGKPQKSYFFLVDSPLRGGGGKGLSPKEKRTLSFFFGRSFDH